jgi:diketogulonate reductase-like aldo/keto reductase
MKYANLPDGKTIPVIGLGTWEIGGGMTPDRSQEARSIKALQAALQMGYTHIDTAEGYAAGFTEELVGRAMRDFRREDLFITSKVSPSHLRYADVLRSLEGSLKRLGTDYLDLYLIHWPSPNIPLAQTFQALNELVHQGKVRYLGVSNFDLTRLRQSQDLSEVPLATNQVPYSLFERQYVDNGVLAYCQEQGILLTAYTPVEKGRVSRHPLIRQVASQHQATPEQVALAWLVRQPQVITIPMSTNPQHLQENLQAADLELTREEVEVLDRLSPV